MIRVLPVGIGTRLPRVVEAVTLLASVRADSRPVSDRNGSAEVAARESPSVNRPFAGIPEIPSPEAHQMTGAHLESVSSIRIHVWLYWEHIFRVGC